MLGGGQKTGSVTDRLVTYRRSAPPPETKHQLSGSEYWADSEKQHPDTSPYTYPLSLYFSLYAYTSSLLTPIRILVLILLYLYILTPIRILILRL